MKTLLRIWLEIGKKNESLYTVVGWRLASGQRINRGKLNTTTSGGGFFIPAGQKNH